MRIIQIGDRKIALREVSVLILLEWIAYFVSRVVSSRWSDCGAKSGEARHSEGSHFGYSDPAEIEGLMAPNMAF